MQNNLKDASVQQNIVIIKTNIWLMLLTLLVKLDVLACGIW